MKTVLSFAIFVLSITALADSQNPIAYENNVQIIKGRPFRVSQRWSALAKTEAIGGKPTHSIYDAITDNFPLINWFHYVANDVDIFAKMTKKIVVDCSVLNTDVLSRISCLANSVSATFHLNGVSPQLRNFPCVAHEIAFRGGFEALKIRRSWVFMEDGSTSRGAHVVNQFVITSCNGIPYNYVIDVGNMPGTLFPNNDTAEKWHLINPNKFPDFSCLEPDTYKYGP